MTKTEIVNQAFALITEEPVTDVTESSNGIPSVWANTLFDQTKEEVISICRWPEATRRASLAQDATWGDTAADYGWDYAYTLPADYNHLIAFNDVDPEAVQRYLHTVEGNRLLTDEATGVITYTANVDADQLSPLAVQLLYTLLASKLAWCVQKNRNLQERYYAQYLQMAKPAKYQASSVGRRSLPASRDGSEWSKARYGSTNG
jgi:hypothetical protein